MSRHVESKNCAKCNFNHRVRESCPRCYQQAVSARRAEAETVSLTLQALGAKVFAANTATDSDTQSVTENIDKWLNLAEDNDLDSFGRFVSHLFTFCCGRASKAHRLVVELLLSKVEPYARALPSVRVEKDKLKASLSAVLHELTSTEVEPEGGEEPDDDEPDEEDEEAPIKQGFQWESVPSVGTVVNFHPYGGKRHKKVMVAGTPVYGRNDYGGYTNIPIINVGSDLGRTRCVRLNHLDPMSVSTPREPYHLWNSEDERPKVAVGDTVVYNAKNGNVLKAVVEKLDLAGGLLHLKFRNGVRTRGLAVRCRPLGGRHLGTAFSVDPVSSDHV